MTAAMETIKSILAESYREAQTTREATLSGHLLEGAPLADGTEREEVYVAGVLADRMREIQAAERWLAEVAAGAAREAALREAGSTLVHLLGRFNGNACDDEITNALLAWQRAALAGAATK